LPAWANDAQQPVETCLRSALLPDSCGPGRLEVDIEATVSPSRLPRNEFAPVALTIGGTIGTERGGHPSALREAMVTLDRRRLGFHLKVKRGFAASGRRHSYLSARCPNGLFRVSIPKLTFVNEAHTPGLPPRTIMKGGLVVPCGAKRIR
jgi:hypothetical protein